MRKKVRTISVDGKEYAWAIEERLWPTFILRVWRGKGDVWFEKEFGPADSIGPVTPRDVADEIRSRLSGGTTSS
jgi:hypothetical protein